METQDGSPRQTASGAKPLMNDEGRDSRDDGQNNEAEEKREIDQQPQTKPSDTLRRNPYIVFLTLGFSGIALFSWVALCILSHRPIGGPKSYGDLNKSPLRELPHILSRSERYYKAARFLQPVASILTIPLTSMVCSCAAVAFLQRQPSRDGHGLTLRQSMMLADKGWTDPLLISKLVAGGWKRYGSIFLLMAMLLNLLGASIAPLQGIFVSSRSIKVNSGNSSLSDITDLMALVSRFDSEYDEPDNGQTTVDLRSRLGSASNEDPQFRLWSSQPGCLSGNKSSSVCATAGQYTFGSMNSIVEPFWAQPPSGYSTGLSRQFAPRVNFTSKYQNINADEFPENCDQIPGALFLHYENTTDYDGYAVDVCMPFNVSETPWKAQRSRQDFNEELYLNITLIGFEGIQDSSIAAGNYIFKLTLDTTAGYFELPNYMNGELPGPLLDDGPGAHCGEQCSQQFDRFDYKLDRRDLESSNGTDPTPNNAPGSLSYSMNKGPLLSTALALFGAGSYLDIHHTVTETYQSDSMDEWGGCIDVVPLTALLQKESGDMPPGAVTPCVSGYNSKVDQTGIVADYLWLFAAHTENFYPTAERIQEIFAASAFLAVDIWSGTTYSARATVLAEPGADLQIPHISSAGINLISILLGIYLTCLLALSLYTACTPRWTNQLDSFAMMRIGGSMPNRFPFQLAHNTSRVKSLDELPGWIGDVSDARGGEVNRIGELGLGGEIPIKGGTKYPCYAVNDRTESKPSSIRQRRRQEDIKHPDEREEDDESSVFLR